MIHKTVLENGVRVLVEPIGHVQSAAIGLWCATGSKDENEKEGGITHLIEHMLFKGTTKRTAKQIAEEIEGRGGSLNAFTDKEQTCYYCRVLAGDVANGIDVLCDMMTDSLMEPEELGREKGVVLEEIKRGEDEPSDHVHELHLSARWGEHPLGKPIIGTKESVSSFDRTHLIEYMKRRYLGGHIVLSVAGNVDPDAIVSLARKALGSLPPGNAPFTPPRPGGVGGTLEHAKDVEAVHFCIGTDGSGIHDDSYYPNVLLDGVLGSGMSSRLFQEIREKRGLAYAVGSYSLSYSAGGMFTIYGGTSPENWEQVQVLVRQEFDKIVNDGVPDDELLRTKRLISGHIVLGLEGMSSRMIRMAKNEICHGRDIPVEETLQKVNGVSNDQIVALATTILDPKNVNTTTIGPF